MPAEIFKTNVQHPDDARFLLGKLGLRFPSCRFNFDLEDADRILRAERTDGEIPCEAIRECLLRLHFYCETLNYLTHELP